MLQRMDILTTKEAAELLRVTVRTVKVKAAAGEIPARKVGQGWRFSREALLRYIEGDKPETVEVTTRTVRRG
jgi:excisionase family DNA binding protein